MNFTNILPLLLQEAPIILGHVIGVLIIAALLGWGIPGWKIQEDKLVLKLPGGAIMTNLPLPEGVQLLVMMSNRAQNEVEAVLFFVVQHYFLLRVTLIATSEILIFVFSLIARITGKDLVVECMDDRIAHGHSTGTLCMHPHACGAFATLTLTGTFPLMAIFAITGLPGGMLGWILLSVSFIPVLFIGAKLLKNSVFKNFTDGLMFVTETVGTLLSSVYTSFVALRLMTPGLSKM